MIRSLCGVNICKFFYEFSPWSFVYEGQETKTYRYVSGLNSRPWSWLSLRVQQENELRYYDNPLQENTNPHGLTTVAQLGDFTVPWTTVKYNIGYWNQRRENAQGTLDNRRTSWRLRVQQLVNKDLFWYVNGVHVQENSLRYEYVDRIGYFYANEVIQSEVSGGFSYSF